MMTSKALIWSARQTVEYLLKAPCNLIQTSGTAYLQPCNLIWKAGRAQVAQSVEQWTENPRVGGSIPPLGTIPLPKVWIYKGFLGQTNFV